MTKITNEMWIKAMEHLEEIYKKYRPLVWENVELEEKINAYHYLMYRYYTFDRSEELYNAIMELR